MKELSEGDLLGRWKASSPRTSGEVGEDLAAASQGFSDRSPINQNQRMLQERRGTRISKRIGLEGRHE